MPYGAADDQLVFILSPPTHLCIAKMRLDLLHFILQILHLVYQNAHHSCTKRRKESISPDHKYVKIIDGTDCGFGLCLQFFSPSNFAVSRLFVVADLFCKGSYTLDPHIFLILLSMEH